MQIRTRAYYKALYKTQRQDGSRSNTVKTPGGGGAISTVNSGPRRVLRLLTVVTCP